MRRFSSLTLIFVLALVAQRAPAMNTSLAQATNLYDSVYRSLKLEPITLLPSANVDNFGRQETLALQQQFFSEIEASLDSAKTDTLQADEIINYALLEFELALHQKRLAYLAQRPSDALSDHSERMSTWDDGGFWYAWLLQKWTGTLLSPEQIQTLGEERLAEGIGRIKALSGVDVLADSADCACRPVEASIS